MRTPGQRFRARGRIPRLRGVITAGSDYSTARYCAGTDSTGANTYNVVDVSLAGHVPPPAPGIVRRNTMTSACGVCGKDSIESVPHPLGPRSGRRHPDRRRRHVAGSPPTVSAPNRTSSTRPAGLHAAALFDADGELLVVREDVGRHNAVDKVIGWAVLADRLPLSGTVLQVSGRASFELVQKAAMAGVPMLSAVSAPSSLAADLADELGITLIGFSRGESMVVYTRPDRITTDGADLPPAAVTN